MIALSRTSIRVIAGVVVAAILATVVYFVFFTGGGTRKVTAYFDEGIGVYKGTPVKILGIQVGTVTHVKPVGATVRVDMTYDKKYKVPADAGAFLFANSLVSDRYIQLAPVYKGGAVMADGASIPVQHTTSPAELDDIYSALNQLSVALGPQGANKNGALSTLINIGAANLKGNGQAFAQSVQNLSQAAKTLASGSTDLFQTVSNLKTFTDALNQSDNQVRTFQSLMAQVTGDLADERGDLGAALHNLTIALHDVAGFINANANAFHQDVQGLESLSKVLTDEQASLNEILVVAPIAEANLAHGYQESTGTLGTRSNLVNLTDPSQLAPQLCAVLQSLGNNPLTQGLLGDLLGKISGACSSAVSGKTGTGLSSLTQSLTGGAGP